MGNIQDQIKDNIFLLEALWQRYNRYQTQTVRASNIFQVIIEQERHDKTTSLMSFIN